MSTTDGRHPIIERVVGYFLRGVVVLLPVALTVALIWYLVEQVQGWMPRGVSWMVLLLIPVAITLVGVLVSGVIGRTILAVLDRVMTKTPLVKLIYSSIKDLINAFVGEDKKFSEAVVVELQPGGVSVIGFVTQHDMEEFGLKDTVAVYFPVSYGFSGHLLLVPAAQVKPLDKSGSEVMRFLISGGVTGADKD